MKKSELRTKIKWVTFFLIFIAGIYAKASAMQAPIAARSEAPSHCCIPLKHEEARALIYTAMLCAECVRAEVFNQQPHERQIYWVLLGVVTENMWRLREMSKHVGSELLDAAIPQLMSWVDKTRQLYREGREKQLQKISSPPFWLNDKVLFHPVVLLDPMVTNARPISVLQIDATLAFTIAYCHHISEQCTDELDCLPPTLIHS